MPLILSKEDYYSEEFQEKLETDMEGNMYLEDEKVVSTNPDLDKGEAYYIKEDGEVE